MPEPVTIYPDTPENRELIANVHPARLGEPRTCPFLQPGGHRRGDRRPGLRRRGRRAGGEGGPRGAAPHGGRLPQLRLRPFQGAHPGRPGRLRCPERRGLRCPGRRGDHRRLRRGHGADADAPERHQPARLGPAVPGRTRGRCLHRPGEVRFAGERGGGRGAAELLPRRHLHRRPGRGPGHTGAGGGRLPHQRNGLLPDRTAAAARRHRRRSHRLRTGPGLRPLRQPGHPRRGGAADPRPGGPGCGGDPPCRLCPRRDRPPTRREDRQGGEPRRREGRHPGAGWRACGDRGGRDPRRGGAGPQRGGAGAGRGRHRVRSEDQG